MVSVCVPLVIEANCDKEVDRATPEWAMKATNTIWQSKPGIPRCCQLVSSIRLLNTEGQRFEQKTGTQLPLVAAKVGDDIRGRVLVLDNREEIPTSRSPDRSTRMGFWCLDHMITRDVAIGRSIAT